APGALLGRFFFQAEDGIRDWSVTGVQTCALPIWLAGRAAELVPQEVRAPAGELGTAPGDERARAPLREAGPQARARLFRRAREEIGRASCRERGEMPGGAG